MPKKSTSVISGIYMITNKINNKIYIGQSKSVFTRWSKHYKEAMLDRPNDSSILHKAIRKYGIENFEFRVLELCDKDSLDDKEKYYISLYKSTTDNDNYNIYQGGAGGGSIGSKNHNSKLTEDEVFYIREQYKNLKNWQEVYKEYENLISQNTFKDVWHGKTWKHVHVDVYTNETKLKQRNNYDKIKSHKWMQILSDDEIIFIRNMRLKGHKRGDIHDKYFSNLNINTFNDIWYNHTFKHLTVEDVMEEVND